MIRKWLTIGIILLFIGVSVAPSINQSVVTASQEDDLVEVTTQACGIKGYEDTTVKLTRQQYNDLEQYLVKFRARLNQTSTPEEVVAIFKEAILELDKNGLLPMGMNAAQAQQLILGSTPAPQFLHLLEIRRHSDQHKQDDAGNQLCLTAGHTTETISRGPLLMTMTDTTTHMFHNLDEWLMEHYQIINRILYNMVFFFVFIPLFICLEIGNSLSNMNPFPVASTVGIGYFSPSHTSGPQIPYYAPAKGWIYTNGVHGQKNWSGDMFGNVAANNERMNLGVGVYREFYPGIRGFSGLKINLPQYNSFYLGFAVEVNVTKVLL
jgi:hypothetical protein